jgi:murein DD-endopeptidase MepM/ murein hydrolase activator NlpD
MLKKMYQYRDEDGVLHFSNIHPDTQLPIDIEQLAVEKVPQKFKVSNCGEEKTPILCVSNQLGGPVQVEFKLLEQKNIVTHPRLPARFIILPETQKKVVWIQAQTAGQAWSYRYQYRYFLGNPKAVHQPQKPYRPPFTAGQTYRISQAFHGKFSHNQPISRYAIDIVMPEGTQICASRAGVVMDIANDFFAGGTDRQSYRERANYIRILHADGTMAIYAHLKLESILVGIGGSVTEGQPIALSGNTGFSSGPHLHFAIQKNNGMQLISIPFEIENTHGDGIEPTSGLWLHAN